MSLLEHAHLSFKATKTKSVKLLSTHRVTKSSRPVVTRHAAFGPQTPVMNYSVWERTQVRVTKMKYSLARSIMKEILLLLVQKIILVAFGKISALFKPGKQNRHKQQQDQRKQNSED